MAAAATERATGAFAAGNCSSAAAPSLLSLISFSKILRAALLCAPLLCAAPAPLSSAQAREVEDDGRLIERPRSLSSTPETRLSSSDNPASPRLIPALHQRGYAAQVLRFTLSDAGTDGYDAVLHDALFTLRHSDDETRARLEGALRGRLCDWDCGPARADAEDILAEYAVSGGGTAPAFRRTGSFTPSAVPDGGRRTFYLYVWLERDPASGTTRSAAACAKECAVTVSLASEDLSFSPQSGGAVSGQRAEKKVDIAAALEVFLLGGGSGVARLSPAAHQAATNGAPVLRFTLSDAGMDGLDAELEDLVFLLLYSDEAAGGQLERALRGRLCDQDCAQVFAEYEAGRSGTALTLRSVGDFSAPAIADGEAGSFHLHLWLDPGAGGVKDGEFVVRLVPEGLRFSSRSSVAVPGRSVSQRIAVQNDLAPQPEAQLSGYSYVRNVNVSADFPSLASPTPPSGAWFFYFSLRDSGGDGFSATLNDAVFTLGAANAEAGARLQSALRGRLCDQDCAQVFAQYRAFAERGTDGGGGTAVVFRSAGSFTAHNIRDGSSSRFYLYVWLDPGAGEIEDSTFSISLASEGLTFSPRGSGGVPGRRVTGEVWLAPQLEAELSSYSYLRNINFSADFLPLASGTAMSSAWVFYFSLRDSGGDGFSATLNDAVFTLESADTETEARLQSALRGRLCARECAQVFAEYRVFSEGETDDSAGTAAIFGSAGSFTAPAVPDGGRQDFHLYFWLDPGAGEAGHSTFSISLASEGLAFSSAGSGAVPGSAARAAGEIRPAPQPETELQAIAGGGGNNRLSPGPHAAAANSVEALRFALRDRGNDGFAASLRDVVFTFAPDANERAGAQLERALRGLLCASSRCRSDPENYALAKYEAGGSGTVSVLRSTGAFTAHHISDGSSRRLYLYVWLDPDAGAVEDGAFTVSLDSEGLIFSPRGSAAVPGRSVTATLFVNNHPAPEREVRLASYSRGTPRLIPALHNTAERALEILPFRLDDRGNDGLDAVLNGAVFRLNYFDSEVRAQLGRALRGRLCDWSCANVFAQYETDGAENASVFRSTGSFTAHAVPDGGSQWFYLRVWLDPDAGEVKDGWFRIYLASGDLSFSSRSSGVVSSQVSRWVNVKDAALEAGLAEYGDSVEIADPSDPGYPLESAATADNVWLWRFTLQDGGADGLSATLNDIVFALERSDDEARAQWEKALRGRLCSPNRYGAPSCAEYRTDRSGVASVFSRAESFSRSLVLEDGDSREFLLYLWLNPDADAAPRGAATVSLASEDLRFSLRGSGASSGGVMRAEVAVGAGAERLELLAPGPDGASSTVVRTYGPADGPTDGALQLAFRFVDEDGDIVSGINASSLAVTSLQAGGAALVFEPDDAELREGDDGAFILSVSRASGGGAERRDATVTLTASISGGTTLSGSAGGFTVDVIGNTLASAFLRAADTPDSALPLVSGSRAGLYLRYRLLGCAVAGDPGGDCQPDRNNEDITVSAHDLRMSCASGCTPETANTPDLPASAVLARTTADGSVFVRVVEFTVPTLANLGAPAELRGDWIMRTSDPDVAHAPYAAYAAAPALIVGDTVSPTFPAELVFTASAEQPYQLSFRWSTAATDVSGADPNGVALPLSEPDAYTILYADPVAGGCPPFSSGVYATASAAAVAPVSAGFAAVVQDAFDGGRKIAAETEYCFILQATDGVGLSTRTMTQMVRTAAYNFALDNDGDGMPDHLAPLCSACASVTNPAADDDSDGINNALEAYLAEDAGVDAERSDGYSDANGNGIPDILELHYGSIDRTPAPSSETRTCHAAGRETRADACGVTGLRRLLRMNPAGEGVYEGAGTVLGAADTLGSGTHWLLDGSQLMRLDLLPRLTLSGAPAEIPVTAGNVTASYSLSATLEGPYALDAAAPAVLQLSGRLSGFTVAVAPSSLSIPANSNQPVQISFMFSPPLTFGDNRQLELIAALAAAQAGSVSEHSFANVANGSLPPVQTALRFQLQPDLRLAASADSPSPLQLVLSTNDAAARAVLALRFRLEDGGGDSSAATLNNVVFTLGGAGATDAQLRSALRGRLCADANCATVLAQYEASGSEFRNTGAFTSREIANGEALELYLQLWLTPGAAVTDGIVFTVSVAPGGVSLADEGSGMVPGQSAVESAGIIINVGADRLELLPPSAPSGSAAAIRTYGPPGGDALRLSFRLTDRNGNVELGLAVSAVALLQVGTGTLGFDSDDVRFSESGGLFTLAISRVSGGGAEGANRRVTLGVTVSGGATLSGSTGGFTVDVIGNTLASAFLRAADTPDSALPLVSGSRAGLYLRYRLLGCAVAGDPGSGCEPDRNNEDITVSAHDLRMSCASGCTPETANTPDLPASAVLSRTTADGSFFVRVVEFTVPTLADLGAPAELRGDWIMRTSDPDVAHAPYAAYAAAPALIVGDIVSPTFPAELVFTASAEQPYQLSFRWSTAATDVSGADPNGVALPLSEPDAYSILYADPVAGRCPVSPGVYATASAAAVAPVDAGFAALAQDAFDGGRKIQADAAYCFILQATDGVTTPARTAPEAVRTPAYNFAVDSDGMPDHLAPLCDTCASVTNPAGDSDGDGISNALEAYLAEDAGVDAERSDAYSDANGNGMPDILELRYGAIDRAPAPTSTTATCHAAGPRTPALNCAGAAEGMRLLVEMNAAGEGVYTGGEWIVVDRNTWLDSGTHWLADAAQNPAQLTRLDIFPLLTLSAPAEIVIAPGAATAAYFLEARLQGPYPLSVDSASLLTLTLSAEPAEIAAVADPSIQLPGNGARRARVSLSFENRDDAELHLTAEAAFSAQRVSRHSFQDQDEATGVLPPVRSVLRFLDSAPAAKPQAFTPYLADPSDLSQRMGGAYISASGPASWVFRSHPPEGIGGVSFACVQILHDPDNPQEREGSPAAGSPPGIEFTVAGASLTGPALARAWFYGPDPDDPARPAVAIGQCGEPAAADRLLGQLAFLVFPEEGAEPEPETDNNGNLIPDSMEGGVPEDAASGVAASGDRGLPYETAGGDIHYLRSPGVSLRLGEGAAEGGVFSPNRLDSETVSPEDLAIPDAMDVVDGLALDFEAWCPEDPGTCALQAEGLVRFVFRISETIQADVWYYKQFRTDAETLWCPMRADYSNSPPLRPSGCPDPHQPGIRDGAAFALPDAASGACPPAGSKDYAVSAGRRGPWMDVPQSGDRCVQLSITNGGPNDGSQGVSNIVSDPGLLARAQQQQAPPAPPTPPASPAPSVSGGGGIGGSGGGDSGGGGGGGGGGSVSLLALLLLSLLAALSTLSLHLRRASRRS